ncbi:MAG: heavy metal-binding domain-containing protein, partial [Rhodothermales bacterium]
MNKKTTLIALAAALLVLVAAGLIVTVLRAPDASDETPVQTATDAGQEEAGGLAAADENGDGIVYQSGMHPWIVEDEPGQCPICGMDLQPVSVSGQEEGTVRIDPVTQQNIGVRTAKVEVASLPRTARTTGRFEASEEGQV